MTIASTPRRAGPYATNGVQTDFAFDFKVFDEDDLRVVSSEDGVDADLALTTDYTVDLNDDQDSAPGGTVTLLDAPDGPVINILSEMDAEQPAVITNRGGFFPRVFNDVFDRLTIYVQQINEKLDRALLAPLDTTTVEGQYPVVLPGGAYGFSAGTGSDPALRTDLAATGVGKGALLVSVAQDAVGAVARTAGAKLRDSLSVFDFIPPAEHDAIRDGTTTTDVTSYIVAAMTAAQAVTFGEQRLVFPSGTYRVTQLNLRDYNYFTMHAEGTVQIVGTDGSQGYIIGDDRFDDLGHTENFTTGFRMSGGPWAISPLAGENYARGLKLQNFVDCVFENVSVSGAYTPTGGAGDRIAVELELSFNNAFYNMSVGYPGAPIGADKSYGLFMGTDNVNANRFYGYRGVGNFAVASTYGVRVQGTANNFFGGDISAIHTAFEDHAAKGCHRYGMYHESVTRVLSVSFASRGCIVEPGSVSIIANGTAYDLSGVQTIRYTIRGGNHSFNATGTTGLNKGASCYALTYEPGIDTGGYPATAVTGTDNGSGGADLLKGHELSAAKINFPDTPVPSANPTTLDCYLEANAANNIGISVGGTAQTVGSVTKITKIGRVVTVTGYAQMAAALSGTGPVKLTNLPYFSDGRAAASISLQNATFSGGLAGFVANGGSDIEIFLNGAALTHAALTSSSLFDFSITYTATS